MFDWQTRMKRRKELPQKMQEWYDSDAPGETADTLIKDMQLNPEKKTSLIRIVGDTVLGLIPVDGLPEHIQKEMGVPLSLAQVLAEHLVALLVKENVTLRPQVPVSAPTPVPVPRTTPPVTREAPLTAPTESSPTDNSWTHTKEESTVAQKQSPEQDSPADAPLPSPVPHYQKPLTTVPQYRNANLYLKPGERK